MIDAGHCGRIVRLPDRRQQLIYLAQFVCPIFASKTYADGSQDLETKRG